MMEHLDWAEGKRLAAIMRYELVSRFGIAALAEAEEEE